MPAIVERLKRQLSARGVKDAMSMAYALAHKHGLINKSGELTAKGKKRQAMGAVGRAKDRAAKANGGKPNDYKYNPKTNRARKRD